MEPRASPNVIKQLRRLWLVAMFIVVLVGRWTSGIGSDLAWLFWPLIVLGGWWLISYLERAPRKEWIVGPLVLVPFVAGFYAPYPAGLACWGFALVVYGGVHGWPRLRSRRAAA